MKVAIVGATGLVGRMIIKVLEERNFKVSNIYLSASKRSVGSHLIWKGNKVEIMELSQVVSLRPDIALFSAGSMVSKQWAPKFVEKGAIVIDNSSQWRMNSNCKLIVFGINNSILTGNPQIIANPNCSTIQLTMILAPIHKKYGIKRVVISTYQSVTGTGKGALEQLESEEKNCGIKREYPHQIYRNVIPHCDVFNNLGYTKEEMKLVKETKKILEDSSIGITATAARVPVVGGHSESVNIELKKDFDEFGIREELSSIKGVCVLDNPANNLYPMPILSQNTDQVYVGRIRRDYSQPKTFNCWIVSDNLRKGAATNAVQIAEFIVNKELMKNKISI